MSNVADLRAKEQFLHEIFSRFGIPDLIVSDDGTQSMAKEFGDFCQ